MARALVDQLLFLLDESFDSNDEHSLIGNLREVKPDDWSWTPPLGRRTIGEIAEHAGIAKYVYADHLFGEARLSFFGALKQRRASNQGYDPDEMRAWLRAGHATFRDGMTKLSDDDLARASRTHWGATAETRWIISVIIQHDAYHAGEINHLRALRQGNDVWWANDREANARGDAAAPDHR